MKHIIVLFLTAVSVSSFNAQIGIGSKAVIPVPSAVVEVKSDSKGLLAPRMTTAQRKAITNPAQSLLVYDTDLKSFYNYNATNKSWEQLGQIGAKKRSNYQQIRAGDNLATILAAELAAGGGTSYKLNDNTLYEINGTVTFDKPINLNNAYLQGVDSGEDKLIGTNIFVGDQGGTIKGLTISSTSGQIFTLTGAAVIPPASQQNLIFRDCIVTNSKSIGKISNFGMVFLSIVQFAGNQNGIVYDNISQLLLSNVGWFGNNTGTFEKLTGSFKLVQKLGGFTEVNGTAIGFDVSSNPTITGDAVLENVAFTTKNAPANPPKYVSSYKDRSNQPPYSNYNFTKDWTVASTGIPTESDRFATGTLFNDSQTTLKSIKTPNENVDVRIFSNNSATTNLFRFEVNNEGRLVYEGKKSRIFDVHAIISYKSATNRRVMDYEYYFVTFPVTGAGTRQLQTITRTDTLEQGKPFISTIVVSGTVLLQYGESVDLYLRRVTSGSWLDERNENIEIVSYNVSLK